MDMEKLVALCRRKGFIFQSSEIYGGINGFWDYGPLGVELKKNIKEAWWNDMVRNPPLGPDGKEIEMVGVDCAIIMNPKVWEASGHVGGFADPMVDCSECKKRYRADKIWLVPFYDRDEAMEDLLRALENRGSSKENAKRLLEDVVLPYARQKQPKLLFTVESDTGEDAAQLQLSNAQRKLFRGDPYTPGALPLTAAPPNLARLCPNCQKGTLGEPRQFNLMFESHAGALQDEGSKVYLRPETAQGIFANFRNVVDSSRVKLPFGIAQIGKAFRNEINPRNYTFRSREFEQMEIEFFCHPDESMKWYQFWRDVRKSWYTQLGIQSDRLRPREQGKEELAHYSIGTTDIEYLFPFSDEPQELEGVAHRGAYDLTQHAKHSGKDLSYFDEDGWNALLAEKLEPFKDDKKRRDEEKKKLEPEKGKFSFLPHVIEPSAGADRFTLAVLCEAYSEDAIPDEKGVPQARTVMKFHPRLAPIKAAILPLVNKEGIPEKAHALYRELKADYNVVYDDGGAVGRRYRRQDEVGTPFCFTIDFQTLQDDTVTIRERDSTKQRRVPLRAVADELRQALRPSR